MAFSEKISQIYFYSLEGRINTDRGLWMRKSQLIKFLWKKIFEIPSSTNTNAHAKIKENSEARRFDLRCICKSCKKVWNRHRKSGVRNKAAE